MLQACVCLLLGLRVKVYVCVSARALSGSHHHHHQPADTKFPFLSRQRERNEGKSAEAGRGWAGKLPSAAAQAAARSQGQVPSPAAAPAGGGGAGQPPVGCRRGRGAWVRSSHLARGGPPGSPRRGWCCRSKEPRGAREFWSRVLFRPQHSCPRVSHRGAPSRSGTSGGGWGARGAGSPLPRLQRAP